MESINNKIHVVCMPFPAQGHIQPMFQLAKLLHAQSLYITFVHTEYNHRRLLGSCGPNSLDCLERFKFETIPDGLPPSDAEITQDIPTLCQATLTSFLEPFKELLRKLNSDSRVSMIVSDVVMPFTLDAAIEIGNVKLVWLWTASMCGFLGYAQYRSMRDRGIVPFGDSTCASDGTLDKVVDCMPNSLQNIQLKYIPSFIQTTDKDDIMFNFLIHTIERSSKSSAPIIFNSFDKFELDALSDVSKLIEGPIYTIGPLQSQLSEYASANPLRSNLWKEDSQCLQWLDSNEPSSVVYISFGSITTMTNENLVEFAWGIANTKQAFLWVLRPDLVTGEKSVIPPELVLETKGRGLITSWCDQESVLHHPSVSVFLTHCGWNSTLDTVCGGVPVLCWPFFAEQQTNCWFSCGKWGIGMEIDCDVKRAEVEKQVNEVMDGEKGKGMRRNVREWKKLSNEAVERPFGSSYLNFNKFVKDVVLPLKQ